MSISKLCKNCGIEFFRKPSQSTQAWQKTEHCEYKCRLEAQIRRARERKKTTEYIMKRHDELTRKSPIYRYSQTLEKYLMHYAPKSPR